MTDPEPRRKLTFPEALAKATECREIARSVSKPEHKVMLEHMAEMWDSIAKGLANGGR